MAQNQQLDSLHFDSLDFPYNTEQNPLVEKPRVATGSNTWVKWGGSIAKRPGTIGLTGSSLAHRIDRLWIYQTIESSPKVYLLASAYNASTTYWEMYYLRLDATTPAWTKFTDIRDVNASTAPHECIIARGHAFIKGLPASGSSEKLGSMRFDGTGGTVTYDYWGLLGPQYPAEVAVWSTYPFTTTAEYNSGATSIVCTPQVSFGGGVLPRYATWENEVVAVTAASTGTGTTTLTVTRAQRGTTAVTHLYGTRLYMFYSTTNATHSTDVASYGRKYSYAKKTRTGQVSNRAIQQPIVDMPPSETKLWPENTYGCPYINYKYTSKSGASPNYETDDLTYVPYLDFFRTTDGGGTLLFLKEIANTNYAGAGAVPAFEDKYYESGTSGGTYTDPLPDSDLSANDTAPSTTSNSPPPTCNAPSVVGTDAPQPYSPMAYYAGRIWFAINEVLYFSAQEELTMGIPEESFPSGLKGNFFRYSHPIKNVVTGTNGVYVFTTNSVHQITGTNKESFSSRVVLDNVGVPFSQPRAAARLGSAVAFLSDDERILLLQENDKYEYDKVVVLTDPIGTAISTQIAAGKEIDLDYYRNGSYEWLIVSCHDKSNPANSTQYICDLGRSREAEWKDVFWYTPWTVQSTACVAGRIKETETRHRLIWYIWNPTTVTGCLAYLDDTGTTYTDTSATLGSATAYTYYWGTNLFSVPPGNHINALRKSAYNPVLHEIRYERKNFASDSDPGVTYYIDDDYATVGNTGTNTTPTRRDQSSGYTSLIVPVRRQCQRVAVKLSGVAASYGAEFYNLSLVWEASGGN